jgi:hypothetical protein
MKLKLAVGVALLCGMSASANAATTPAGLNLGGLLQPGANLLGIGEGLISPILTPGSALLGDLLSGPISILVPKSTGLFGVSQLFGIVGDIAPLANPVFSLLGTLAGGLTLLPALPALPGLSLLPQGL